MDRHMGSRSTPTEAARHARGGDRWRRRRRADHPDARVRVRHVELAPAPDARSTLPLEEVWDRHGRSVYALACALLGDEEAAARAVQLGMSDLARTGGVSADEARRSLARHVYRRSQELVAPSPRSRQLPPAMVWLGQLAHLQRSSLALCMYGGHTHREAAALLGVPALTVAGLLSSGLRELGRLSAGGAATA